jgi:hypothetical protein
VVALVAVVTEGDEVGFLVISGAATELYVMDLQVLHTSTPLTRPAIPLEHTSSQTSILIARQPDARSLGKFSSHETISWMSARNAAF